MKPGSILSLISAPQGFQRLIDTEEALVLSRVSDGLRRTSNYHYGEYDKPQEG
jgi:hypothetical protein